MIPYFSNHSLVPLRPSDVHWVASRLPKDVYDAMKADSKLILAGGFIRACIANEKPADIDLFSSTKEQAGVVAGKLAAKRNRKPITTDNAITIPGPGLALQFIHRWTFETIDKCIESFDFTIASAAIAFVDGKWVGKCHEDFYSDLAGKRLVYLSPVRNEDAGGSMLRVLKFYQRGYRIPLDSLGAVIARLMTGINKEQLPLHRTGGNVEAASALVLSGLLREVDPLIDPDHITHLPSTQENLNDAAEATA